MHLIHRHLFLNADFTALFNDVSQVASENDAQLDLLSRLLLQMMVKY